MDEIRSEVSETRIFEASARDDVYRREENDCELEVEIIFIKKAHKKKKMTAEQIARMADKGVDVSKFFTNKGKMMPPIQRVNVDFTLEMLAELDEAARQMNVSRQAVIKTLSGSVSTSGIWHREPAR